MRISLLHAIAWPRDGANRHGLQRVDRWAELEAEGWDGLWITERAGGALPATLVAAHVAAATDRIRIGALSRWPGSLHPLRLAEDIAMVDVVADGRLDWGIDLREAAGPVVGRDGIDRKGIDGIGTDRHGTAQRASDGEAGVSWDEAALDERVEVVRRAWQGGPVSHDGPSLQIEGVQCVPSPAQEGGPPLYVATDEAPRCEWAASRGHGRIAHAVGGPGGLALAASGPCGRAPLAVVVALSLVASGAGTASAAAEGVLTGDVSRCRARLAEFIEAVAPDELIIQFDVPGSTGTEAGASRRHFVADLAPALR